MTRLRKWITWAMALVLLGSIATWYLTLDTLPSRIKLATALPGGL